MAHEDFEFEYTANDTFARVHQTDGKYLFIRGSVGCLPAETEFMTLSGWKRMDKYTEGDFVAQWDGITKDISFVKPTEYIIAPATELHRFSNKYSVDMVVSDEHRIPYYNWRGDLKIGTAKHIASKIATRKEGPRWTIPNTFRIDTNAAGLHYSDAELRVMVAVHADGHFSKNQKLDDSTCEIYLTKKRKIDRLIQLLDRAGIAWNVRGCRTRPDDYRITFKAPGKTKDFRTWWGINSAQAWVIYSEFCHWDGIGHSGGDLRYSSSVRGDADFIQFVCHATGHRATISTEDHSSFVNVQDCYIVHVTKDNPTVTLRDCEHTVVPTTDGYKYCFTVPTSYFLVRHNGKVFVTGNSGKSSGCILHCFLNALKQAPGLDGVRRSKYAVLRASYPNLKSTTIDSWVTDWFGPLISVVYDIPIRGLIKMDHPDGKTSIEMKLVFLALDREEDVNKLQSLQVTGAHLNEAAEIPRGIFQMLKSRIDRYPRVRTLDKIHPDYQEEYRPYLNKYGKIGSIEPFIIHDYNSVATSHWLYKIAEEERPDKHRFWTQPPALLMCAKSEGFVADADQNWYKFNPLADNLENLTEDYYVDQCQGADPDWISVFVLNNYGSLRAGKPVYKMYIDKVHFKDEYYEVSKGIPIIVGLDTGLCYTDDHEVLTKAGWKFFKDVNPETDQAATRNPKTGEMEYTDINFKVDELHDGPMLEWDSQNVSMCVTPEHRVPVTYRDSPSKVHFKTAQWLADNQSGHHYVDLTSKWVGTKQVSPIAGWSFHLYCQFMGWWLSEGSLAKNINHNRVCITQKDIPESLARVLMLTGLNWKRSDQSIRVSNKKLAQHLRQFGKCHDKFVPQCIKDSTPENIRAFIDTFTEGDGHLRTRSNGSEEHMIYTSSTKMADDFVELCQKAGWNSSLSLRPGQACYYAADDRWIKGDGCFELRIKKRAARAELLKRNFKQIQYTGHRYCLNVPYHTLYVRRNGRPHWNGNTPAAAFMQFTSSGELVVFDELVTEDTSIHEFAYDVLWPHIRNNYKGHRFEMYVDPENKRGQTDKKTAKDILIKAGFPVSLGKTNNQAQKFESVVFFLRKQGGFRLTPNCPVLRKGFISEFKYEKVSTTVQGTKWKEKPEKNIYCVPKDVEVLTSQGFKQHNELVVGDHVYGYDLERGHIVDDTATAVNVFNMSANVIDITGNTLGTITMSDKHRVPTVQRTRTKGVYTKPQIKFAEELSTADHMFAPKAIQEPPKKQLYTRDFINLSAWVSAEGTRCSDGSYTLGQSIKVHPAYCDHINSIASRSTGCVAEGTTYTSNPDMMVWRITKDWARLLDSVYEGNKVPSAQYIVDLNNKDRRQFLYEYIRADGCWQTDGTPFLPDVDQFKRNRDLLGLKPGTPRLYTCDTAMANALHMLATITGLNSSLHTSGNRHVINLLQRRSKTCVNNFNVTQRLHTDGLWCPSTTTGLWVCRIPSGRVFVTGNSHVHEALQYGAMEFVEGKMFRKNVMHRQAHTTPADSKAGY